MENFDKFLGVYATSGDLQTALSTQALKSPWVALVGEYAHPDYNELNWIALYVGGNLECIMPKDAATNSWTALSTLVNSGVVISFKAAYRQSNSTFTFGEVIPFYYDRTLYTASYTLTEDASNPVLQLTNGDFYLTYTPAESPVVDTEVELHVNGIEGQGGIAEFYVLTAGTGPMAINQLMVELEGNIVAPDGDVAWYSGGTLLEVSSYLSWDNMFPNAGEEEDTGCYELVSLEAVAANPMRINVVTSDQACAEERQACWDIGGTWSDGECDCTGSEECECALQGGFWDPDLEICMPGNEGTGGEEE